MLAANTSGVFLTIVALLTEVRQEGGLLLGLGSLGETDQEEEQRGAEESLVHVGVLLEI